MDCGIYKIVNKINGKFYIGSTTRLNIRKHEHNSEMKLSKSNSIINKAVRKYGKDNLQFEVIESFIFQEWASKEYIAELLESREQYYVDLLNPPYNIRKKDITKSIGVKASPEWKKHLSNIAKIPRSPEVYIKRGQKRKGKFLGENNKNSIKIYIFDSNKNPIEEVKGLRETSRRYDVSYATISYYCKNNIVRPSKNKYIFSYSPILE